MILTDAPGSTPPDESFTTPAMKSVEFCASARVGANSIAAAANIVRMIPDDRNERMIPPQNVAGRSEPGRRRQAGRRREVRTWNLEVRTENGSPAGPSPARYMRIDSDNSFGGGKGRTGGNGRTGRTQRSAAEGSSAPRGGSLERRAVENSSSLVAHLLKDASHGAVFLRDAFLAGRVCRLTDTRYERERSVERADDVAHADLVGGPAQLVAAAGPLAAVHEATMLEGEQDAFEKLFRNRFLFGEIADEDRTAAMLFCQRHHRLQPVLAFARQH